MMDADLNAVPTKTISLKRAVSPNIPMKLLDDELKNKRRARFATDAVQTKVSKTEKDDINIKKREIRFSENPTDNNLATAKQNFNDLMKQRQMRFSEDLPKSNISQTKQSYNETLKHRQIRFSEDGSKSNKIPNEDIIGTLKKRKERFGEITSTLLKKIEVKEKVLQRKARFAQIPKETTEMNETNREPKKKIVF